MTSLDDNEELERSAPFLAGLPKADPFVMPDGFFERFPHAVQAAITDERPAAVVLWPWWKRMAVALPIIAAVGLGIWILTLQNGPAAIEAVAVTPLTDVELDALDDGELLAAFDDAEEENLTAEDLGAVALQLNADELLAYLEQENADIDDLITDIQ